MNLQVLMFKPEQPKIQMYMSYINPCSLYLCYTKLIFFSPQYSKNCYKTILLLMLFLLTITAQQTDQVYMKGSLDSTLKGIFIYFITEFFVYLMSHDYKILEALSNHYLFLSIK